MGSLEICFEEAFEVLKLENYTDDGDFIFEVFLTSQYTKHQAEINIFEEVFPGFFCFYFDFGGYAAVSHCYFYYLERNWERYYVHRCNKDFCKLMLDHYKSNFLIH